MEKADPASLDSKPMFRSVDFRSTLECGWVPNHGVEFFTLFVSHLHAKWRDLFKQAEFHLCENVCITLYILSPVAKLENSIAQKAPVGQGQDP